MKRVRLKHGQERRVLNGCLWIFANQVEDSLGDYQSGEIVRITLRNGRGLGTGYINPHSLIAVRFLTSEEIEIDADFFRRRFLQARELRQKTLPEEEAVREIFSESDGLPGLVVDRYKDILVVQITTAGMEGLKPIFLPALQEIYQPRGVFERSDLTIRKLEGLEESSGMLWGDLPARPPGVKYAGMTLPVDVRKGQKTGLYLDQRENLKFLTAISRDARVLDAFSYTGSWGIKAARGGAAEVVFLEASDWALEQALAGARRNRVEAVCKGLKGEAFELLKTLGQQRERFDVVILDPPSFIKSRSHFKEGYKGYFDLNQRALKLVRPGGFLLSCSCSHLMDEATFDALIRSVLQRSERSGRLLYKGRQGPDHPVLPAMPETEYLHCLVYQIL